MDLWADCPIDCADPHSNSGILQRYVHLTRQFEAPASYHVFSLLTMIAAATGRMVVIDRGGYRLWPNLYVLLHGPSGMGKSIAAGHAQNLMEQAVGDRLRLYPDDLTGEGLFQIMYDQTENKVPCIGFVYADEFADLLGGQEYKSELAKRLTKIYASQDKQGVGRSKFGERWVRFVFLNILGCSQEDWLRTLPIHAVKGGLFARIITVPEDAPRHSKFYPEVDRAYAEALIGDIADRFDRLKEGMVRMTPEAFAFAEHWYETGKAERLASWDPIVRPWCERQMDHALKLGYLNTFLEGDGDPHVIDEEGVQWGISVTEWLLPRLEKAFINMNETSVGELHRIVETYVREKGLIMEHSLRSNLGHRWSKGQIDAAIRHLVECDKVNRTAVDVGGGRLMFKLEAK